ncbi:MAG: hypothetical protein MUF83_22555 [Acidimicrobiales bacterium]|nr:hypothetical protein [Acidimicrobiales bacterium]
MIASWDPVTFVAAGLGLALLTVWALLTVVGRVRHHRSAPLPPGTEALVWSITECLPDPRNHVVLKDPTSEMRLTDAERRRAAERAAAGV